MNLKVQIQLWVNVQLWTFRPHLSGDVMGAGWGEFSFVLMECMANSPVPPGSAVSRRRRRRSWTVTLGGPLRYLQATGWWKDGMDSPLSAWVGLWRLKAERQGSSQDSKSEIKLYHLDHWSLITQHYG